MQEEERIRKELVPAKHKDSAEENKTDGDGQEENEEQISDKLSGIQKHNEDISEMLKELKAQLNILTRSLDRKTP